MNAQLARFVISLAGMLLGFVIFMTGGSGWMPVAASLLVILVGFSIAEAVFRRLADQETLRRDLEERTPNES
jgi:uncharacterized membrane protein